MMGVLFASTFISNVAVGAIGGWWERMSRFDFILLHAAVAIGALLCTMLIARPASRLLAPRTDDQSAG